MGLYEGLAQLKTVHKVRISTQLNNFTPDQAREKFQSDVKFMLDRRPDVCMRIEQLHVLGWKDRHVGEQRDWRLQIAMTWNSLGAQPLSNTFWATSRRPHNKENLGLGGFHYC
jgi:hypothetical protein